MKYVGQPCTSCRQLLKQDDDIVVCPECGSPYHRECYKNEGRCVNTLLHENGESWQPAAPAPSNAPEAVSERVCPNCGAHNSATAAFCESCGVSLDSGVRPEPRPEGQYTYGGVPPFGGQANGAGGMNGMPQFMNIRTVASDTDVDGNTVGEYSEYVGGKFYYYIPKFLRFAKSGSKFSFNFAAFFFPQFWFAYRKMPLYSAIAILASVILGLPSVLVYGSQMGMISLPWLESSGFMMVDTVFYLLSNVFSFACGIFGNYLYYRKAKAEVTQIKQSVSDRILAVRKMQMEGGVSMGYVWAALGGTFLLSMIVSTLLMI